MKRLITFLLVFIFLSVSVCAVLITDDFNDNSLDASIWLQDNITSGNFVINETSSRLEIDGNTTSGTLCAVGQVFIQTLATIENGTYGDVEIDFRAVTPPTSTNDHFLFAVTDHVTDNSWLSAPPTYCGVAFDMRGDNFRVVRNYPTSALVSTIQAMDSVDHVLRIVVRRGTSDTDYDIYFDGVLETTVTQDTACADPNLNVSIVGCSSNNAYKLVAFDNFEYEATTVFNGTGAGCDTDADCESGKCNGGFCVLKLGNEDCTSDDQCLSGTCTNGKCSRPDFLTTMLDAKDQQFGDTENSNNFIAMFFMVGIPFAIIMAGKSAVAVMGGVVIYFALATFFTVIGMLSPFILIISIFAGLVMLVLAFVLRVGGD